MRMRHIILSSVACPTLLHFYKISHKRHDFWKKKATERKMSVFIFSTAFV
jgi:hypothetical protein